MAVVWGIGIIFFLILEASTVQFVCIWFAGGALGALIAALLGASSVLQVLIFAALSALCLALSRPLVRKKLALEKEPTNADRLIGQTFPLTEDVDNLQNTGCLIANGITWSVRSQDDEIIPKGTLVTVVEISGSKLIVINKK